MQAYRNPMPFKPSGEPAEDSHEVTGYVFRIARLGYVRMLIDGEEVRRQASFENVVNR